MTSPPGADAQPRASRSAIVPRWEWRTFGQRFDTADRYLEALTADLVQNSDEQYLLSVCSTGPKPAP